MSDRKDRIEAPAETRCGFDDTLKGEHCERPGEVWLMGLHLCEKHARQVEIEDRIASLQGIASSLKLCMSNVSIRRNDAFTGSLRSRRSEAVAELEYARQELRKNAG